MNIISCVTLMLECCFSCVTFRLECYFLYVTLKLEDILHVSTLKPGLSYSIILTLKVNCHFLNLLLTLKLEYYFPCTVKLEWYFHFVTQSFALYSFKLEHLWGNYFRLKNPFPCLFKPKYQFLMLFQSWSTISDILHYMCVISHVLLQTRMSLCTCLSWNKGLYC